MASRITTLPTIAKGWTMEYFHIYYVMALFSVPFPVPYIRPVSATLDTKLNKENADFKLSTPDFLSLFRLWTTQELSPWPLVSSLQPTHFLISPSNKSRNYSLSDHETYLFHILQENGDHPVLTGYLSKDLLRQRHHLFNSLTVIALVPREASNVAQLIHLVSLYTCRKRDKFLFISPSSSNLLTALYSNPVISGLRNKLAFTLDNYEIYYDPYSYNHGVPRSLPVSQVHTILAHNPPVMGFNLRGRHFRMAGCVDTPPYHFLLSEWSSSGESGQDGTEYRLHLAASQAFNFTFDTIFQQGTGYGSLLSNGTWIGMISNLIYPERNFDFTVTFAQVEFFYPQFDYVSAPTCWLYLSFVQGLPSKELASWNAVFSPFTPYLWLGTVAFYVIVSLVLMIASVLLNLSGDSYFQSFYIPLEIALEQGVPLPSSQKLRILILPYIILTMLTGNAYRTVLLSFLTFPTAPKVPETFAELASRPDYTVMLHVMGEVETQFFQQSRHPVIQAINSRLHLIPPDQGKRCFFGATYSQYQACLAWFPDAKMKMAAMGIINENDVTAEPFQVSKDAGVIVTLSVPFQKDSIFVDSYAPIIGALLDTGIHDKWKQDIGLWFKMNGVRVSRKAVLNMERNDDTSPTDDASGGPRKLKVKNLVAVFAIPIGGLVASGLAFWMEHLKRRFFMQEAPVYMQDGCRSSSSLAI